MSALATDLEDFYFRYDFSDGTRQFIGSASQAFDPVNTDAGVANFVAAYGQDGSNTAVHVKSNAYGTDKIGGSLAAGKAVLAGDWTLAMSVRPGSVEKGLLFSLGRANENNSKCVFLASSSTAGKIYVGTARKKGSANSYKGSVDRELAQEWGLTGASADTTSGYHSIVAVHSSGGTVAVYVDGELAGSVDTTENASGCVFGNGIQFNQAHGSSTFLSANGYSQSLNNPDVAFQDVRFYDFAFTAETAAAYAALYPATLPEFSNLDQYAYVQSYGVNGVDTGYKATDNTKFVADFEFTDVSNKSWLMGASEPGLSQTHAIYLNGSKQLAWTTRGQHWVSKWPSSNITGTSIKNVRLVENILSAGTARSDVTASVTWYNARTTMNSKLSSGNGNSLTTKGPSTVTTHLFRGNGIMDNDGQACKAKIYSFEVDDDCTSGVPAAFFAPTTDGNGAAGFTNVVAGTFHGECLSSPETPLSFTPGIGQAEDYRYRSGKFYSRIYARSADASQGLVKFDGGEAAGTNAQFTARGKTATITAVPAEGCKLVRWVGDTWAITSGSEFTADITVKSDTAIQLRAMFVAKSEMPYWTNVDGTGSLDSAANWTVMPESGDNVIIELSGDTEFTSSEEKTFGQVLFTGAYSADFSNSETITLSEILVNEVTNLVTGGKLKFTSIAIPQTCTVTITGAEGLADGGISGKGTLVIDPGAGNTYTMTKDNTSFTGEAVIKSGTVKFGAINSFGPLGRAAFIRVKRGAILDENRIYYYPGSGEKLSKAILEEGAILQATPGYRDTSGPELQYSVLTTLQLEGNATVDTSSGIVTLAERWHDHAVALNLGANTLTVTGNKAFGISHCTISGTGTIDIQNGTTVISTQDYDGSSTTTCANGTIRIREGGKWSLVFYHKDGSTANLSVKNLILDGSVTRDRDTFTLTVTGTITGNGTTPMLTMGSGAVFKPSGTGYLTITESLSGKMKVNIDDLAGKSKIPLLKVPESLADTARTSLDISGLGKWELKEKTVDGYVCFDIAKMGLIIVLR